MTRLHAAGCHLTTVQLHGRGCVRLTRQTLGCVLQEFLEGPNAAWSPLSTAETERTLSLSLPFSPSLPLSCARARTHAYHATSKT